MKKRFLALCCALTLMVGLALSGTASGATWYEEAGLIFVAINDQVLPFSADTIPIRVGSVIYVPYTLFDANQNGGFNLGIYNGGLDTKANTLTFYTADNKNLTFDLNTGVSYDYILDGTEQEPRSIIRNGRIYVSVKEVCNYFYPTLKYYYKEDTKYCPLLRISNSSAQLSDPNFVNAASTTTLLMRLNEYYALLHPQPTPTPPPVQTPPPGTADGDKQDVRVYLAVRMETGQAGQDILDTLSAQSRAALLLFDAADLANQAGLIRRAAGEGHVIGLRTGADTAQAAEEELAQANRLLEHIALQNTRIVLAEDAVADALEDGGWFCWRGDLDGTGLSAYQLVNQLERREGTVRITLDDSTGSAAALTRLLRTLREDEYDYRLAVETEF